MEKDKGMAELDNAIQAVALLSIKEEVVGSLVCQSALSQEIADGVSAADCKHNVLFFKKK